MERPPTMLLYDEAHPRSHPVAGENVADHVLPAPHRGNAFRLMRRALMDLKGSGSVTSAGSTDGSSSAPNGLRGCGVAGEDVQTCIFGATLRSTRAQTPDRLAGYTQDRLQIGWCRESGAGRHATAIDSPTVITET